MKLGLWMFATAGLVAGAALWLESIDVVLARQRLLVEVEKLRPLVTSPRFDTPPDPETIACMERLVALDEDLDRLAPYAENVGTGMTWQPKNRAELFALARKVEPVLDALAQLAVEREGRGPLPCSTKIWRRHHRTDLFCVAALVESDDARARLRFEQAFDVSQLDDDGGAIAFEVQNFDAGTLCRAARQRAERHGRDLELEGSLQARFEAAFDCELLPERIARDIVRSPYCTNEDEPCVEVLERWTREANLVHQVLAGGLDPEWLRVQAKAEDLCFIGLFYCDPESAAILGRQRRL